MEVEKTNTVNEVSKELAKHLSVYENSTEAIKDIHNVIENVTVQIEDTKKSLEQVHIILTIK